eukprot:scaffold52984_cov73-Phaeocystis_antarctica.AAC.4
MSGSSNTSRGWRLSREPCLAMSFARLPPVEESWSAALARSTRRSGVELRLSSRAAAKVAIGTGAVWRSASAASHQFGAGPHWTQRRRAARR